jgi:hypothetical protein
LQIYHNPNAKKPLSPSDFGGITQHFFEDGSHHAITPDGTVLASRTLIIRMVGNQEDT